MVLVAVILGIFLLLALYGVSLYNRLVKLKNLVQEGWSGIEVMLKKRHDLIPNLVETVKGYASHERSTLESVTQARAQAVSATTVQEKEAAEKNLSGAMMRLNAVAEQYPDLKANTNFLDLQTQLAGIEGDLEKARRYYNGTVRENNTAIETFPGSVIASMYKFSKSPFFEMENPAERAAPEVKF